MKTPNLLAAWLLLTPLVALGWSTPSCTDESIVLASVSSGSDAGSCLDSTSCPAGTFCSKTACTATLAGFCEPIPVATDCTQPELDVCGCDGVSYFNECLRKAAGVPSQTPADCRSENAISCTLDGVPCLTDAGLPERCAVIVNGGHGPDCSPGIQQGTCWVIPAVCPAPQAGTNLFNLCNQSALCVNTCTAIQAGIPYRRATFCPPPQPGN